MVMQVNNSLQQLNTIINQVNQMLVPDRIIKATFNLALAEYLLVNRILVEHHKQEAIRIVVIKVMVNLEKATTEAQLDSQAYQLEFLTLAFLELAYLKYIKIILVLLSSSKFATIVISVRFDLPYSQLLLLPFRYVLFLRPFKNLYLNQF